MLALYAAALDPRIDAACVSGYFDCAGRIWREPIDRNVFGLLEQFGDAELASMVAPRTLIVEAAAGPEFEMPPGTGGAPGRLVTPALDACAARSSAPESLTADLTRRRAITWSKAATARAVRLARGAAGLARPRSARTRSWRRRAARREAPRARISIRYARASSGRCTRSIATTSGCCARAPTCARSS